MDNDREVYKMLFNDAYRNSSDKPKGISKNALNLDENWQNDPNIYMLNAPNTSWTRNFNGANGFAEINVSQNNNPPQN